MPAARGCSGGRGGRGGRGREIEGWVGVRGGEGGLRRGAGDLRPAVRGSNQD